MRFKLNHAGGCCGMHHISGMNSNPRGHREGKTSAETLVNKMTEHRGEFNNNTTNEIILSDRQTREMPELLKDMARLGYTYTSAFIGRHRTPVHVFHRARNRLALSAAHFYQNWTGEYGGMVINDSLSGSLPAFNDQRVNNNNGNANWPIAIGSLVRVNSRTSGHDGSMATVISHIGNVWDGCKYSLQNPATGEIFRLSVNSVVFVREQEEINNNNNQNQTRYVHPNNQPNQANAPIQAPIPRVILTEYFAVFRASGNKSRPFVSVNEVRNQYPNIRRVIKREVYSDGRIEETDAR